MDELTYEQRDKELAHAKEVALRFSMASSVLAINDLRFKLAQSHMNEMLSKERRVITAEAQTTAPTKAEPSAAQAPASIAEPRPQSLPLDPHATESGPAALFCGCAEPEIATAYLRMNTQDNVKVDWCLNCRVLRSDGRTLAPAAVPTSSTSQKQASPSSAASLNAEPAPSASAVWTRCPARPCAEAGACCWIECWVPEYSHIPEQRVRPEGETQ